MDLSIQNIPGEAARDYGWLAGDGSAFETAQSCTIDVSSLTEGVHYDADAGTLYSGVALSKSGSLFVAFAGVSEVQTVTITGGPTGGTFTLTFDGETTTGIAYNAAASAVQSALEALSNVNPGDVTVTGDAGGPYTVTFGGRYSQSNVPALTASGASLTGGSTPGVTIATPTAGVAGTLDGFVAHPIALANDRGVLADTVIAARIVDAVIVPSKLPVPAHRAINPNTPTTGKFAFVS